MAIKTDMKNKRGRLTAYAFACGYIERESTFKLWQEHGVYHVNGIGADGARHWYSASTLTAARKLLRQTANAFGTPRGHIGLGGKAA